MHYKRLIYKKKYSLIGIMLFLLIFSIRNLYKISKYIVLNIIKFGKWYRRYIKFVKSGYSYSEISNLIKHMDGRQFERFMTEVFKSLDYTKAILTQETNDGGKDIILYGNDGVTYVECKRWDDKFECGRVLLQKLVGSATADRVDNMIFVTTSHFNKNAYEYASKLSNLELWDMDDIMRILLKIDQNDIPKILAKSLATDSKIIKLQLCQR